MAGAIDFDKMRGLAPAIVQDAGIAVLAFAAVDPAVWQPARTPKRHLPSRVSS